MLCFASEHQNKIETSLFESLIDHKCRIITSSLQKLDITTTSHFISFILSLFIGYMIFKMFWSDQLRYNIIGSYASSLSAERYQNIITPTLHFQINSGYSLNSVYSLNSKMIRFISFK